MLLTKEVEIKMNTKTVKHYESLGYRIPLKKASESYQKMHNKEYVYDFSTPIKVKVKHLTKGCKVLVDVLCDYCCEEVITMTYNTYTKSIERIPKNSCEKCKAQKEKEYFMLKYGVENPFKLNEFKEKVRNSCAEKYGVDNYFKTEEFKEKRKTSMLLKYGVEYPLQSVEIQEQWRNTCIDKYGFENPAKAQNVRAKIINTNLEKYGGVSPASSIEIREKMTQTLYKNSTISTSKQQFYIFNLYNQDGGSELNYPISYYNIDICFPEEKLAIEYDGGGHDLRATLGRLTQDEFNQKELIRNNVIKHAGYKQMRISSSKDKLPSDIILLEMLSYARNYFSEFPNHSWIEFDIDSSTVRNAENKEGVFFNYGELRKIKDTDLNKSEEEVNTSTNSNFWNIKNTDLQEIKTA